MVARKERSRLLLLLLTIGGIMFYYVYIEMDFSLDSDKASTYNVMTTMNETAIRCKAKRLGCFVPLEKSAAKYRMLPLINDYRDEMKLICFEWCFNSGGIYAGLGVNTKACLCSSKVEGFISDKTSKQWAESRWDKAKNWKLSNKFDVFKKLRNCGKDMTERTREDLIGWTILPKDEETTGMLRLQSSSATTNQCILNCEIRGFVIAMPYPDGYICFCCDYPAVFTNAEAMTGLASRNDANTTSIPVYRTYAEDSACMVRFGNLPTSIGPIALTSFPGSGNTWIRHLLEISTGIYTGSVYGDMDLYETGMLGEPPAEKLVKQIVVKDHIFHRPKVRPQYKSAILLIRNPYHAVIAEWSRRRTKSHVGHPPSKVFNNAEFRKFAYACANDWLAHCEFTLKRKWKVLVIYYENLRENPVKEMRRVAEFLQLSSIDHRKNFERRLMCMQSDLAGNFKRPPRNLGFDPFAEPSLRRRFEDAIKKANNSLIEFEFPPLPNSYL